MSAADLGVVALGCAALALAAGSTAALLRPDSLLTGAIEAGLVAAGGVTLAMLVAGVAGSLTVATVLALQLAWAFAAASLVIRRRLVPRRPQLGDLRSLARRSPWATALVVLAVGATAWEVLVALMLPPYAYDAITYHLTIVSSWVQAGDIDPTPLSLCCAYYPANPELLFGWPMLLAGGDVLVATVQIGFGLLGALAVAGLARSAGLPRHAAVAAAALFLVTPALVAQAPTNFADVLLSACVLAGLHSLVRFAVTGAHGRLVAAGVAAGLVIGTKGTGLIWGPVLVFSALALVAWHRRSGRLSTTGALRAAAAATACCVALGSYWYARNWIEMGNPVYPFEVEVAGAQIFDGPSQVAEVLTPPDPSRDLSTLHALARSWAADVDFWNQGGYDYQHRNGGLGPLWPWLALPLLVPFALTLWRRRSPVLLALGLTGAVLVVQPYSWWARFTLPLMGIGALAIAATVEWARSRWLRGAVALAALALAVAGLALTTKAVEPASRAEPLPLADLLGLVGGDASDRSLGEVFFPEYRFLERLPAGARVAVDLRAPQVRFVAPLFGPELTRTVVPARGSVEPGTWVVTGAGRALDRSLSRDPRFSLSFSARGVHVFAPRR